MYKAADRETEMKCAIKCVKKDEVLGCKLKTESIIQEMDVLQEVAHPSLIRTYELLNDDKYFYMVQELARHGDLFKLYREREE